MQDTEVCLQVVTNVVFYKSPGAHKSRRPFCSVPAGSWVEKPEYYAQILKGFWWHSNDNFAYTTTIYLSQALVDCSQSPIFFVRSFGPHSHILMTGGPRDFFGSDILAKKDFFGSMKDAGIFFGSREQHRDFFEYCIFHQLKSTIYCLCGITGYFWDCNLPFKPVIKTTMETLYTE